VCTVIYGCIDIGSNTTRLLVAEPAEDGLRKLLVRRAFTRIGSSLDRAGVIPAAKVAETAEIVAAYAGLARDAGAQEVVALATAAIRRAANRDELAAAVAERAGLSLRVIAGEEEARLSFMGATLALPDPAPATVAVVDVGGGSTEVAVGRRDGTVEWSDSVQVGSGLLTDAHLHSDPPTGAELEQARRHAVEALSELRPPAADGAVAVGGTATSLYRLVGPELNEQTLTEGAEVLSRSLLADVADRFELDPERVRLLPAGILVLAAVCGILAAPLRVVDGGLREGAILELAQMRGS
jgi:exopolyphosphatase/guanosine-5'-triphosphate,3'-diphosphate pyrophosphatase